MKKKQSTKVWVYKPQAPKFTANEKEKIHKRVKAALEELPKLSEKVSRFDMRANRIYLYELVEQFKPEGIEYHRGMSRVLKNTATPRVCGITGFSDVTLKTVFREIFGTDFKTDFY